MADYDFQVVLHGASGLSADSFVNTLHYSVTALDDLEGTCDGIAAAYQGFASHLAGLFPSKPLTIKAYEGGQVNPAGPAFSKDYPLTGWLNSSGPTEVAICLSYATVDDPESSTPRRRGRIYLGPIAGGETNNPRPAAGLREAVLDLGEALASVGFASATTWMLYSPTDKAYAKIESIWTDDSWDTQRRRGQEPTLREVRDVQ